MGGSQVFLTMFKKTDNAWCLLFLGQSLFNWLSMRKGNQHRFALSMEIIFLSWFVCGKSEWNKLIRKEYSLKPVQIQLCRQLSTHLFFSQCGIYTPSKIEITQTVVKVHSFIYLDSYEVLSSDDNYWWLHPEVFSHCFLHRWYASLRNP